MSVLEKITIQTKRELEEKKKNVSIDELLKRDWFNQKTISFSKGILEKKQLQSNAIIAEFKRKSPSKGIILENADILKIAQSYQKTGAVAISVLTSSAFDGNILDIELIRESINIPILRKEFIVDEYQIFEAKAIGCDAILLIAASLSIDECNRFTSLAQELGLQVLLEVHGIDELEYTKCNVDVLGINNRNLKTFKINLNQSIDLISQINNLKAQNLIKESLPIISESGLDDSSAISKMNQAGFDGYLIGESLMKSNSIEEKLVSFINAVQ